MRVGIGYHNRQDATWLGRHVAEDAMANGAIERPSLVLAFCSGQTDHAAYFNALQAVIGDDVPIIGGSAVGIITNHHLSYEGDPAGAAVIESDTLLFRVAAVCDLDKDEKGAGQALGKEISDHRAGKLLLMFYDSVKDPPSASSPPIMNASPPLIEGIEEAMGSEVPIIGAGLLADYAFSHTRQFCGSFVDSQCAVGILLDGAFKPYYRIMHGCAPLDGIYHTITKIKGSVVYEVDGLPVVKLIDETYGNRNWRHQVPLRRLTIGVNHGEKYGPFEEGHYVNRVIAGSLPHGQGIVLFEPDLEEGTQIVFMLRDSAKMIESARKNAEGLMEEVLAHGRRPAFGLYIDCAGRAAHISETLSEEAREVQDVFNRQGTPLLGFYSGVEVAPLLGKSRGLDWTGVLMILAEE
ncbi:MAG: FIST N-terminal domain-containing protein [Thermodesulfobacteriota bacterium]|nr:FIST N-terminal domain-containing protein [Thermodesulfobacteriota bacterium]